MLIVPALGVVAAVTGRGQWYGLAAILLAVLGSELLPLAIPTAFPPGRGWR